MQREKLKQLQEAAINTSDQHELTRLRSEAGEDRQQAIQAARKAAKAQAKAELAKREAESMKGTVSNK